MKKSIEKQRIAEQKRLDDERSQEQRNINGQFATPFELASQIVEIAFAMNPDAQSCLEPACGTGSFLSALNGVFTGLQITAIEKDSAYCEVASRLWSSCSTAVVCCDFFDFAEHADSGFDLLVSNPPYSRHHHIPQSSKEKYQCVSKKLTGVKLSQLAGLHAHFILSGTSLLNEGGVGAWLIPAETFSVNFGKPIKDYLTSIASIERIHFFDESDLQFGDALVSSCVAFVRKKKQASKDRIVLTKGGTLNSPLLSMTLTADELRAIPKWQHAFRSIRTSKTVIGDLVRASRGVSSGDDKFFVKSRDEWHQLGITDDWLQPVLPPPRYLSVDVLTADDEGWPVETNRAMLRIDRSVKDEDMPDALRDYLSTCSEKSRSSYTLTHRKPWYSIERRDPAPIVCTYMSRSKSKPFRFIRNKTKAITTMAYLCVYPLAEMSEGELDSICECLQGIDAETLIACSREYGGGLRKLEPSELMEIPITLEEG